MISIRESPGYIIAKEKGWKSLIKGGVGSGIRGHRTAPKEGIDTSKFSHIIGFEKVAKILGQNLHVEDMDSSEVQNHIKELSNFSEEILSRLKSANIQFFLGKKPMTELDSMEHLKGKQPRGWPPGSTWDRLSGCYSPSEKQVIAGFTNMPSGTASVIGHETGHAIYFELMKDTKLRSELQDIHEKHFTGFYSYYKQGGPKGNAGVSEMIAEAIAANVGPIKRLGMRPGVYSSTLNTNSNFPDDMNKFLKENKIV